MQSHSSMAMSALFVYTLVALLCNIVLASQTNVGRSNETVSKDKGMSEDATVKYEMGIDSIIISGDGESSDAPDAVTFIVENVTQLSTEAAVTDNSVMTMSTQPTVIETTVTEDEYNNNATEGYTEPSWETSSINSVEEIYEMKERLAILESRVQLLEDVNLVWWNNFREMGAPLPKKIK